MKIISRYVLKMMMILAAGFVILWAAVPVEASARTATWVVAVTYQNVGTAPANITVNFFAEGSATSINFNPLGTGTLQPGAGASFFIGSVSGVASGFRGSAVMSADQPLVATVVQFSQDAGFKMRLLSNAFQSSDGSAQYLVPTVFLNRFSRTTVFSIQNTESEAIDATVKIYDADNAGVLASSITHTIPAQSSKYIEMDDVSDTGLPGGTTVFNGSAIVTAVLNSDGTTPASVVSAASEYYTNRNVAANFEGVPLSRAANTIYMATALCEKFGLDSYYAVQNASLSAGAQITVTYKNVDGTTKATDGPYSIGGGQKKSISTCSPNDATNMSGFTGSAVIQSSGAPIVSVGKAQGSFGAPQAGKEDVFTIFLGEPQGATKLALPFVRWANDTNFNSPSNTGGKQRTFIAVQNLESTAIDINVKYFDKDGNLVATQPLTIQGSSKANSDPNGAGATGAAGMNPGEFGYYTDGSFGGGVLIEADASNPSATFIAIARVQHPGAGEDYNAVPAP
ncbi:MAG: hypothetical protein ACC700_13290 [Anaerolineales bacterium]